LLIPIRITTVAVDFAAKASADFLDEVPVITQNSLKRLFCQRNSLTSWYCDRRWNTRNYKGRNSKAFYEFYFFTSFQRNGSPPFNRTTLP
jgi:hypothetical protein